MSVDINTSKILINMNIVLEIMLFSFLIFMPNHTSAIIHVSKVPIPNSKFIILIYLVPLLLNNAIKGLT